MNPLAFLRSLVLVKKGEAAALVWSAAYFFFLLSSYYVLRPVREMSGIEGGADKLPWLMAGTMTAMLLANPLFSWLVSSTPRRRFVPITYHIFALNMAVFWGLMLWLGKDHRIGLGYAFYIWVSVFNLFAVSVFWSFMADMFTTEQSKRLFGSVGVGGTLGAICGAATTAYLVKWVGNPFHMLLVSAALLEMAVVCILVLSRIFGLSGGAAPVGSGTHDPCPNCGYEREGVPVEGRSRTCPECGVTAVVGVGSPALKGGRHREPGPGILAGVGLVLRSPYLLLICVYLFLYAVLNTFLYIQQGQIVDAAITDRAVRTAFFAKLDLWTNALTITTQLFVAGRLIRGLGVGLTLGLLPLISAIGFAVLWFVARRADVPMDAAGKAAALNTMLSCLAVFQVTRRGVHYAVSQPSRQILYTNLGPDEIYKSKPFIDTFVYRGGDLVGAFAPQAIVKAATAAGLAAVSAVPAAAIPIALFSLAVGVVLGKMQGRSRVPEVAPAA